MQTTTTSTLTWVAACDACTWVQQTPTCTDAGQAARAHGDTCSEASTTVQPIPRHTPQDGGALPELTAATATAEIAWVAREARALRGSDDEPRRARYFARKRALLAYIERTTGGQR